MKLSEKIRSATNSSQQPEAKMNPPKTNPEDTFEHRKPSVNKNVAVFDDYIDASKVDVGNLQNKPDDSKYILYSNPDVIRKIRERFHNIDKAVNALYGVKIFIAAIYLFFYCLDAKIFDSFPWNVDFPNDILSRLHYSGFVHFSDYFMSCKDMNTQLILLYFVLMTIITLLLLGQFSTVYEFDKSYKLCIFMIVIDAVALIVVGFMWILILAVLSSIALLCINMHKSKVLSGMVLEQEMQLDMDIREDYII